MIKSLLRKVLTRENGERVRNKAIAGINTAKKGVRVVDHAPKKHT